jgi:hypothetical protein
VPILSVALIRKEVSATTLSAFKCLLILAEQNLHIFTWIITKIKLNSETLSSAAIERNALDRLKLRTKLHGLSPRANSTVRATAACRRSNYQLLRIEGATWSAWHILTAVFSFSKQEPLLFYQVAPQLYSRGWVDPVPDPLLFCFW